MKAVSNTINAAERVGLLSSLLGKNTVIVKHSGSDYKGASKGTKEQDLEFGELEFSHGKCTAIKFDPTKNQKNERRKNTKQEREVRI